MTRIAFAGEHGAFAEDAVLAWRPDADPIPVPGFREVFQAVAAGRAPDDPPGVLPIALGALPIENLVNGTIRETYDLLLTPTVACPPFKVGLDNPTEIAGTSIEPYGWIPFTYPFNMTGQPAASVPCGFTSDGLPIGLQIVGRRFDDATVLRAAAAFEKAHPWAAKKPPIA